MEFTRFTIIIDNEPFHFFFYEKCDCPYEYQEIAEKLIGGKIHNLIKFSLPELVLKYKTNLFKGKSVEEYIDIYKKLYKTPIKYTDKEMGINSIKNTIIRCLRLELYTETVITKGCYCMDGSHQIDMNNIEKAYSILINKGYQNEINYKIKYGFSFLSGIYEIVNIYNNKRYIGRTNCIASRWSQHKNELKKNTHHCKNLQKDFNKYGIDAFRFNIIEIEEDYEEMRYKERYWWDNAIGEKYNSKDNMMGDGEIYVRNLEKRVRYLENQLKIS